MNYREILSEIYNCVEEILENSQPSYIDKDGYKQQQLFVTSVTGKDFSQEPVKAIKEKDPKRVEGGKRSFETRKENKKREFVSRPIFQALNYNPEEDKNG